MNWKPILFVFALYLAVSTAGKNPVLCDENHPPEDTSWSWIKSLY